MIYFANPKSEYIFLKKKIDLKIKKILNSNSYILGNEVTKFERKFSKFLGVKYSIGVSSGTDALVLALKTINIKKGDEVLTTSHTAYATIAAIIESGATPVFVDIKESDFTIDVNDLKKKITKRTKAIIAVHVYGNPADITKLFTLAKEKKIILIEDCAQAHGAEFKRKKIGSFGDFACFSFYPTKNLSTFGDAGVVSTNNRKMYKKLKLYREYGWKKKNVAISKGYNKRLDEIHAGILNVKLDSLNKFNLKRISIAKKYLKLINSKKIVLPNTNPLKKHVFHLFVIRVKNNLRSKFLTYLKQNGISPGIHYPIPNHKQIPFKKYAKSKLPITEKISNEIVSIPNYPLLKDMETDKIIKLINKF